MLRSLAYAARSLKRSPAFVALAVLSMGIGIGVSSSVYAMLDRMMHPITAFSDVEDLFRVQIYGNSPRRGPSAWQLYDEIPRGSGIESVTLQSVTWSFVQANGVDFPGRYARVAPNYFSLVRAKPRLGRLFRPDEAAQQNVAVVSDAFWKHSFRNRSSIGDATVTFGDRTYTIVGVMPPNSDQLIPVDAWLPFESDGAMRAAHGWITIRTARGLATAARDAQLSIFAKALTTRYAAPGWTISARTFPLKPDPLQLTNYHTAMLGAAVLILIIGCANVSSLMLARGITRTRDSAIRLSLGASRSVLVRDVIAEVIMLSVGGAAVGLVAANWGFSALAAAQPPQMAWLGLTEPSWSWRVFTASVGAALVSAAIASLLPAWQASRVDPAEPLKEGSGTTTGRVKSRFRPLVIAELTLSTVLLVGASLMVKATLHVATFDFGYAPEQLLNVVTSQMASTTATPRPRRTTDALMPFIERVRATPGVTSVTSASYAVPDSNRIISEETLLGAPPLITQAYQIVGQDFLRVMRLRLSQGRDLGDGDRARGGIVLEERAASVLFPHGGAIGKLVKLGDKTSANAWVPVVAVVGNSAFQFHDDPDIDDQPKVFAYLPTEPLHGWHLLARTAPGAKTVSYAIQRELKDALGDRSFVGVTPMLANFDAMLRGRYFLTGVFVLLGAVSLLLAAAGLFSVLMYAVGQRRREFAVRAALGAQGADVVRLVLRDALELALLGAIFGCVGGIWAGNLLSQWLYNVEPADASAIVGSGAVLVAITMLSGLAPAIRAMRADPIEVLRAT